MLEVSKFEANLLTILRCFLKRVPLEQALPLIARKLPAPRCLGRPAVELIQDSLAMGTVLRLAGDSGWRNERYLRGDQIAGGRLWERTSPEKLGLNFTRHALKFLIWITANRPTLNADVLRHGQRAVQRFDVGDGQRSGPGAAAGTTSTDLPELGDRLLFFLACETLENTSSFHGLLQYPGFASDGLLCLVFPDGFAECGMLTRPQFHRWILRDGTCVLEALQSTLAARCVEIELRKQELRDWEPFEALSRLQDAALSAFLKAIDDADRCDLARFLLRAAHRILSETPERWFEQLQLGERRLAERAETCRLGFCFLRHLLRLQDWDRRARTVGYLDEGYAASQVFKADWESHEGDDLCARTRAIIDGSRFSGHWTTA